MTKTELYKDLKNLKAYKAERVRLGQVAIDHKLIPELIQFCYPESGVSHQACWSLEQSFLLSNSSIYAHLDTFTQLYEQDINSSGMRSLCNIASIISRHYYHVKEHPIKNILKNHHKEHFINGCFNQLIISDKAANLAYAINALYYLGKEYDWIYEQLIPILEKKLTEGYTAGFQNMAQKTLKKLGH